MIQAIRLTPSPKPVILEKWDVDSVALEADEHGDITDFRLEVGWGYFLAWLVPIEPNGRMRLLGFGPITCEDYDNPTLEADPCPVECAPMEWRGDLATLHDQSRLIAVRVELTADHCAYRCTATTHKPDGSTRNYVLAYRAP